MLDLKRAGAVFLVNAKSRRGQAWYDLATEGLYSRGVNLARSERFKDARKLKSAVRAAIQDGIKTIIIGGGDGTISSVAHDIAMSGATLGVMPLGTGNAFARDLGIETDVNRACDVIAGGRFAEIDLGTVNGKSFLNVATIGLSTLIARELEPGLKRVLGPVAYGFALIQALRKVRPFTASLNAPGIEHSMTTLQIVIGNGKFHAGPFLISPDASLSNGMLVVYALETKDKYDLIRFALAVRNGHHVNLDNVAVFRLKEGEIYTTPSRRVTVDGETSTNTPVTFRVSPGALRVLVPPEFEMSS